MKSQRGRYGLECQTVELLCSGHGLLARAVQLPLADHVHDFDTRQQDSRASKCFETEHRSGDPFDRPVILFNNIVQILVLWFCRNNRGGLGPTSLYKIDLSCQCIKSGGKRSPVAAAEMVETLRIRRMSSIPAKSYPCANLRPQDAR